MTMIEEDTKVPVAEVVNLEVLYGRELLNEVTALTVELAPMRDRLAAFVARAIEVVDAFETASCRVLMPDPVRNDIPFELLEVLTGVAKLEGLARETGLHHVIFDHEGRRAEQARTLGPRLDRLDQQIEEVAARLEVVADEV